MLCGYVTFVIDWSSIAHITVSGLPLFSFSARICFCFAFLFLLSLWFVYFLCFVFFRSKRVKKNKNKEWKLGFSITNFKINANVFDHSMLSHTAQNKEENVKTVNIYSLDARMFSVARYQSSATHTRTKCGTYRHNTFKLSPEHTSYLTQH